MTYFKQIMEGTTSSQAKGQALGKSVSEDDDPRIHSFSSTSTTTTSTTNSPTAQEQNYSDGQPSQNSDSLANGSDIHSNDEFDASAAAVLSQCLQSVSVPVTVHFEDDDHPPPATSTDSLLISHEPSSTDAFSHDSLVEFEPNDDQPEPLNASSGSEQNTQEETPLPRNEHDLVEEHADLIVQQIVFESVRKATQAMPISGQEHSPPASSVCMTSSSSLTSTVTLPSSLEDASSPSSFPHLQSMPAADDDDGESNPKAVLFANQTNPSSSSDSEPSDCSLSVSTTLPNGCTSVLHCDGCCSL